MHKHNKKISSSCNLFSFFLYIIFLLVLLELGSRSFWAVRYKVPFFNSKNIIYVFYPQLENIKQGQFDNADGYFDILLLDGSTFNKTWSNIEQVLYEKLGRITKARIRIYNVSGDGFSSKDNLYQYRYLSDKDFDLVVFYQGINDVRANNCPAPLFKKDYSHYYWYEAIKEFTRHQEIGYLVFPYTLKITFLKIKYRLGLSSYVPRYSPKEEWLVYGKDIRTADSFKDNLKQVLEIANKKNTPVLLMSFAFYVPAGYSLEKFNNGLLDYARHRLPVELWGKPENVVKGINVHNSIIEDTAKGYNNVIFVDQNGLIPKSGIYFNDICHFTAEGSIKFVDNMLDPIIQRCDLLKKAD